VAYQVYVGSITATVMTTPSVSTGGVTPGIICYISMSTTAWLVWADSASGACGVVQDDATHWHGAALFDNTNFINTGWSVKMILFWSTS